MSSMVDLIDGGGASVTVNVYDDCYFYRGSLPIPFDTHMKRVKDMKVHADDVLLCSYPKSGTHSLWKMISAIVHGDVEKKDEISELDMLDFTSIKLLERTPSPRILGSHFRFRFLPSETLSKKPKIIYVQRHPKAVAVSYYNMTCGMKTARSYEGQVPVRPYRGTWDDYLESFMKGEVEYGSWFDHVMEWEQARADNPDLSIYLLHYEDMKQDPAAAIQKLAEYLGKSIDEESAVNIAKINEGKETTSAKPRSTVKLSDDGQLARKCRAGDWKEWFTVGQNERFDALYDNNMSKSCFLDFYK